jgi:hypothetical protein
MPLLTHCPGCQGSIQAPDEAAGRNVRCPRCRLVFLVQPLLEEIDFYIEVPDSIPALEPVAKPLPPIRRRRGRALALALVLLLLGGASAGVYAVIQALAGARTSPDAARHTAPVAEPGTGVEQSEEEVSGDSGAASAVKPLVTNDRAEGPATKTKVDVVIQDEPGQERQVAPPPFPVHPEPLVKYQRGVWEYGVTALRDRDLRPLNKRLTFTADGGSSLTMLRIDGAAIQVGLIDHDPDTKLPDDPERQAYFRTERVYRVKGLVIRHILEVVPSRQPVDIDGTRKVLLDTVLSRYVIVNEGEVARRFAMRTQVDTLIGENDGVPFTVPGEEGLVEGVDFGTPARPVPAFFQAQENRDLQNPGTVALMTLQVGGGVEPPARASITNWYADHREYDVGVEASTQDSCVVMYWPEMKLPPGGRREVGYAYGLGQVDAREAGGKLGLTLGGSFEPGKTFTVTALVTNPKAGQTATLELPAGLVADGPTTLPVPPAGSQDTAVLTWSVRVEKAGEFSLSVSSGGNRQSRLISITQREVSLGTLALAFDGDFRKGQVFTVTATTADGPPGQELTLRLPPLFELDADDGPATRSVPTGANPARVTWRVRVKDYGKGSIRVESSTGLARSSTLSVQEDPGRLNVE